MSRHSFDPDVAAQVGLNAAVIFQNISFWCERNAVKGKNVHDGNAWTFNSIATYEGLFPYLSGKQIRAALDKLEQSGLIETGNFNRDGRDRTKWYGLTKGTDAFARLVKCHLPSRADTFAPEGEPLPDSKPDIKQQIENTGVCESDLFSEMEEGQEQDQLAASPQDQFDTFWKVYPKKAGKKEAQKAWKSAIKRCDPETIIAAAERYAKSLVPDRPGGFVPQTKNAQGWLNGDRWEDFTVDPSAIAAPRPYMSLMHGEIVR